MGDESKDIQVAYSHSKRTLPQIEEALNTPRTNQQTELSSLIDKASAPAIRETWPIKIRRWARKVLG
jgi:hypothetical protein